MAGIKPKQINWSEFAIIGRNTPLGVDEGGNPVALSRETETQTFYSFNNTASVSSVTNDFIPIPIFGSVLRSDGGVYSPLNAEELVITEAGDYTIGYSVSIDSVGNTSRSKSEVRVSVNSGGTVTELIDMRRRGYHRLNSQGEDVLTVVERPVFFNAGDIISVSFSIISGTATLETPVNRCAFYIRKDASAQLAAPAITSGTPNLITTTLDSYRYQTTAVGTAVVFSLSNAPVGMVINSITGLLEWDNPVLGSYTGIVITASNVNGSDQLVFNLDVQAPPVSNTNLIGWWDGEDITGVDGDTIATWDSRQGVITSLSNPNIGQRPFVDDNLFGGFTYRGAKFEGPDILTNISVNRGTINQSTCFIVFSSDSISTNRCIWRIGESSANSDQRHGLFLNLSISGDIGGTANLSITDASEQAGNSLSNLYNDGNIHIAVGAFNNLEYDLYDENLQTVNVQESLAIQSFTFNYLSVGDAPGNGGFVGTIYNVIVYDRLLPLTEITDVVNYLKGRYGL